jgi:hypothetical protein
MADIFHARTHLGDRYCSLFFASASRSTKHLVGITREAAMGVGLSEAQTLRSRKSPFLEPTQS